LGSRNEEPIRASSAPRPEKEIFFAAKTSVETASNLRFLILYDLAVAKHFTPGKRATSGDAKLLG
jgi:hypothetical protein